MIAVFMCRTSTLQQYDTARLISHVIPMPMHMCDVTCQLRVTNLTCSYELDRDSVNLLSNLIELNARIVR